MLNGWQRLSIVIAVAWTMGVISLAVLEYHGSQGEHDDGLFTCAEPVYALDSFGTRSWNRDCGLFPRTRVTTGLALLFDDIPRTNAPSYPRYLNMPRFLAILLGPGMFIGFFISAVFWVARGFSGPTVKEEPSEPSCSRASPSSMRSEATCQSHAEAWLERIPYRWARNAAVGGGLLAAPSAIALMPTGDTAFANFMLVGLILVALGSAVVGGLCGVWARYSLMGPFALNASSAVARIVPNWLTGSILLGAIILAGDVLFGWRKTTPLFVGAVGFGDLGYLTGFFGSWMLGGYLAALMSRWGLRKAIDADRMPLSNNNDRVLASRADAMEREFSVS